MSDPVIQWIDRFVANLDKYSDSDDKTVQRTTILALIASHEEEVEDLEESLDMCDDMTMLTVLAGMVASTTAALATFRQSLIYFDKKHKSPVIGDWVRGGRDGEV